jgi:hypothetical protein
MPERSALGGIVLVALAEPNCRVGLFGNGIDEDEDENEDQDEDFFTLTLLLPMKIELRTEQCRVHRWNTKLVCISKQQFQIIRCG